MYKMASFILDLLFVELCLPYLILVYNHVGVIVCRCL